MENTWEPLTPEAWPRVAIWPILTIDVPDQRLLDTGLNLIEDDDPGLGPVLLAGARLPSGRVCALSRHPLSPGPTGNHWGVDLEDSEDVARDANCVLTVLKILPKELVWVSDRHMFPTIEVHRQDDNGNEFLVDTFRFESLAQSAIERLAAGGHKQMYWTRSTSGP